MSKRVSFSIKEHIKDISIFFKNNFFFFLFGCKCENFLNLSEHDVIILISKNVKL